MTALSRLATCYHINYLSKLQMKILKIFAGLLICHSLNEHCSTKVNDYAVVYPCPYICCRKWISNRPKEIKQQTVQYRRTVETSEPPSKIGQ